jgi:cation:H+ antiporter
MLLQVSSAVCGLLLLTFAADHLVLGASRLARRLRVGPVVIGVVVIGLGTSTPEFLVSGVAAAQGHAGLAVGNIVGSNTLNLTVILGVAALIAPVAVASKVIRREVPLAVGAVLLFALLGFTGLTAATGAVLAAAGVGAVLLLVHWAGQDRRTEATLADEVRDFTAASATVGGAARYSGWVEAAQALLGLAGVLAGAQLVVVGAAGVASRLGVSQLVVGLTVVALGTSLPELVTTIQAQRRGESGLVIGNLFGSNLFNSLLGGAVIGFVEGFRHSAVAATALSVAMVLTAGLAWALLRRGLTLTRVEGLVLLGAYLVTLPLLFSA